jgi:hypothetical protein
MRSFKKFFVLAGAILVSMQVTYADVIYREVFGNGSGAPGSNAPLNTVGWFGAWGPTATDSSNPSPNNFGLSAVGGSPTNLDNVNAGGPANSISNGFVFVSGGTPSTTNFIAGTSQYTVDTTQFSISSISFYAGNTSNAVPNGMPGFHIAVQIGGTWYASDQMLVQGTNVSSAANFHNPPGGASGGAQQLTFNWTTTAGAWDALTFNPGVSLALGANTGSALPGGNITASGLYSAVITNSAGVPQGTTRRFDT